MKLKPNIYLAGGMENETDGVMGGMWREQIQAHLLCNFDVRVWNPCEFEPDQLKGLYPSRLPSEMPIRDNVPIDLERVIRTDMATGTRYIAPNFWHEFKLAPRNSRYYKRGAKYMHRIQDYDLNLVRNKINYLIVNWTKGTGEGAGTHAEIEEAHRVKNRHLPIYIVESSKLPAWVEFRATKIFADFPELYEFLEEELGE